MMITSQDKAREWATVDTTQAVQKIIALFKNKMGSCPNAIPQQDDLGNPHHSPIVPAARITVAVLGPFSKA